MSSKNATGTQVDQNRKEDGRISSTQPGDTARSSQVANHREYSWDEIAEWFPVGGNCKWCGKHMTLNHDKCFQAKRRLDERVQRSSKRTWDKVTNRKIRYDLFEPRPDWQDL